jgi:ABC-2 type transport system ATP-binding protein
MPDVLESQDPRRGNRQVDEALSAPAVPAPSRETNLRPVVEVLAPPPLLLFDKVTKWYGPVIGVNQVTLELRPGITGLVGANGAGKTTLMSLAMGQLRPDLGTVTVLGLDSWSAAAKRHLGYCPDTDTFYEEMSGRQFVATIARLHGYAGRGAHRRTEETLELVGMADRADRRLRGYSKGMRQRIKLAQALVHDPEILILDEPLSGIDPIGRQEFLVLFGKLAARGKCLLVSSHELEELEKLTEHVAVMARGRIAAIGTLAQIRDLLDEHPLSIRVVTDESRRLAGVLLNLADVVGVDVTDGEGLIVRARNPRQFFRDFTGVVLEEHFDIGHLETLDDSAQAILGYLLGASRNGRLTQ